MSTSRTWRAVKHHSLTVYALLVCVYLMLPIVVVILFSFNAPEGRFNYVWQGFTLRQLDQLERGRSGSRTRSSRRSRSASLATIVATVLGTLMALAIVRYHFRGRGATNLLVFLPMATPEIVLGASLLTLFLNTTARLPARFRGRSSSPT